MGMRRLATLPLMVTRPSLPAPYNHALGLDNLFMHVKLRALNDQWKLTVTKQKTPKRRGRPPTPPEQRKRNNVTIRLRDDTKLALEARASAGGYSLSEEMERRLERSFAEEEADGGPETQAIFDLMRGAFMRGGRLGSVARKHPRWLPAKWINDPFCYEAAVSAAIEALILAQPAPYQSNNPDPEQRALHEHLHSFFAQQAAQGKAITLTKSSDDEVSDE